LVLREPQVSRLILGVLIWVCRFGCFDFGCVFGLIFAVDFGCVWETSGFAVDFGLLIWVDFFEIFWYFWWDFASDHGEPEDEPAEGRKDEPA
jgi:hypothetical protein